jgi:hypothetical protein
MIQAARMRIGGSKQGAFGHGERPEPAGGPAVRSRALSVIAAPLQREPSPFARGDAAFLAHLIATKAQAPQTRTKRRADPAEVIAAYRAAARMVR